MTTQAKTVVVLWNTLNCEGADGRNAKKRAQRALNREFQRLAKKVRRVRIQVKGQEVEPENLNWSKYLSRVEYL